MQERLSGLIQDEFKIQNEITQLKENPIISPKLLIDKNVELKAQLKQLHAKIKVSAKHHQCVIFVNRS